MSEDQVTIEQRVESRWKFLSERINLPVQLSRDIWSVIRDRYCEAHRRYHTLNHIADMLCKYDQLLTSMIQDSISFELALFFHDIVYDPSSGMNEEDSAQLFIDLLHGHVDTQTQERVIHYILATKTHTCSIEEENADDLRYFLDLDMSIVGRAREDYLAYARQIRQEYCIYDDESYRAGRAKILTSFLQKPIFLSTLFVEKFEEQARSNISFEKAHLEHTGLL